MVLFICRLQLPAKLHSPAMNGKSTQIRFGFSEPVSGLTGGGMTGPEPLSNGPVSCPPNFAVGRAGCLRYRAQDIGASPYPNQRENVSFPN